MNEAKVLIPSRIYFRIGDVAEILGVKPYVIRFWETEFPFVAPEKASSGQRVYRRPQIEGLVLIKHLLHIERYSIEGAKKKLTELRKTAKLKEAMLALVKSEGAAEVVAKAEVLPSLVDRKDTVLAAMDTEKLTEKLADLQKLIRDPGLDIPGLKPISKE